MLVTNDFEVTLQKCFVSDCLWTLYYYFCVFVFLWYSSPNSTAVNESSKVDWAISPADRAKYTQMFGALDKNKKGYLTGSRVFIESIVWL